MNWDQIQGNWTQWKGRLMEHWGRLTENDLAVIDGRHERMLGKLQELYGCEREEAERELEAFCNDFEQQASEAVGS